MDDWNAVRSNRFEGDIPRGSWPDLLVFSEGKFSGEKTDFMI